MRKTIAIIGGFKGKTYQNIGEKYNCEVLFHGGKTRNGGIKKDLINLVNKTDCVVVLEGAIGHVSMDVVKKLCKQEGVPFVFHKNYGAFGAIQKGLSLIGAAA